MFLIKRKVIVTQEEYDRLRELRAIVSDPRSSPGNKRLAMSRYDRIYKEALKRTVANIHRRKLGLEEE